MVVVNPAKNDPHPIPLLYVANTVSEVWGLKGSNSSLIGRVLCRIKTDFVINNLMGTNAYRVTMEDKMLLTKSHTT